MSLWNCGRPNLVLHCSPLNISTTTPSEVRAVTSASVIQAQSSPIRLANGMLE